MSVVLHLYVCLFVSERDKRKWYLCETPTYFNNLKYFVYIMCYYVVWRCFAYVFQFWYTYFDYLPKFTKISFLFISMGSSFWFGIIWYYVILWTQF